MEQPTGKPEIKTTRLEWFQYFLFWSWNLIFLAFMSFGFAPVVLPEIFTSVRTGITPVSFLLYGLLLACVPVAAVVLGLTVLRRSPQRLFALGYVVEGPLMLVLALRFFAIRQATPGTLLVFLVAVIGMGAFLWWLLDRRAGQRAAIPEGIRLGGLTLMGLTSLYAAVWILFYALPLTVMAGNWLFDMITDLPGMFRDLATFFRDVQPLLLPFSILGFLLFAYTSTLFMIAPVAVPFLSLCAWWNVYRQQAVRLGRFRPAFVALVVTLVVIGLFALTYPQPQARAFRLLEKPPANLEEANSLLEQSETIRKGLLNAYLAPFRYLSAQGEVRHVTELYVFAFDMLSARANSIQRAYEAVASPLLYKPVQKPDYTNLVDNRALVDEPQQAARLYQRFFDTPITEAERAAIVRSVRTTWSADQAEAAWQAVDDREVALLRQQITLTEHGDWAEFELFEAYQNQTAENQEVIYYFYLPESAVLTGVWLSNSPDKAQAFTFQVAPRGAAQQVYREQTRIAKDPALLEQIGPRQYRLRVFPVPPVRLTYDDRRVRTLVEDAPLMYMWMSWRVMARVENGAASWPLPQAAFLRNVYWDSATVRQVNDQVLSAAGDRWLPESLPASSSFQPQVHRVDLPGGQTVLAVPQEQVDLPGLPAGLRLALVIDRSYSMQPYADEVKQLLQALRDLVALAAPLDVYLTASPYRGEGPVLTTLDGLDEQDLVYYGGQNAAQLLTQFSELHTAQSSGQPYDAVLVLTDSTGYELGESKYPPPDSSAPIWMIHVSGEIPLGYDDQTLEAIQSSGGGVAGSLDEALARLAIDLDAQAASGSDNAVVVDLLDGYQWLVLPTELANQSGLQGDLHSPQDPFAALAVRNLVLAEIQRNRGSITNLETLDALHALAREYQIVSPYSSMIVLVNEEQQQMLDRLTGQDDRYLREIENLGNSTLPGTPLPLGGVPEPHEWLLLGLAAALLIYLLTTKRARPVFQSNR
ncbi:MAG: TIGR02921 family PEP-CTERM protein [Anaerolineales bacterium]|nr:TIGR02921 family PEP-CTERM protein [Anaerolineales bacterium]